MASVVVWRLARSSHTPAEPARQLLVRLSGRQMKRGRTFTRPSLLAMLEVLETHSIEGLRALAAVALPQFVRPP